ncbi:protein transport protein Sec24C-like isoform X3 [Symsagittifera roscoffensis]|uniref:protein transport protein Sec24C-like isoform X3 n=1 Tax=Symsagittifera roscoffensis TaxID=84072 RepID=UPI00307B7933
MASNNHHLNAGMASMSLKNAPRGMMPAPPSSFAPPFSVQKPSPQMQQPPIQTSSSVIFNPSTNSWQTNNGQFHGQQTQEPTNENTSQNAMNGSANGHNGSANGPGIVNYTASGNREAANNSENNTTNNYNIQQHHTQPSAVEQPRMSMANGNAYHEHQQPRYGAYPPNTMRPQVSSTPGIPQNTTQQHHPSQTQTPQQNPGMPPVGNTQGQMNYPQQTMGMQSLGNNHGQVNQSPSFQSNGPQNTSPPQPPQHPPSYQYNSNPYQQNNPNQGQRPQYVSQPPPPPVLGPQVNNAPPSAPGFPPMPRGPGQNMGARGPPAGQYPPMHPTNANGGMNAPGYPPQPPMPNQMNNMAPSGGMEHSMTQPHSPPGPPQQPQQRNRLDPDMMPSPINVLADDQRARGDETFETGSRMQPGGVPPLCTTKFVSADRGNCRPQFLRSTLYSIPTTKDMCNNSRIPICLALQPLAAVPPGENPVPLADCSATRIPIRCNRCKAYMSPLMVFVDGGRKFECLLCGCVNEVPEPYFCHLDHTGLRMDNFHRAELCVGSYEYLAPVEYCKNEKAPKQPAYIFMIDVSAPAIRSGMVQLLCNKMKHILEVLPKSTSSDNPEVSPLRVGFATYSHVVHFYNLSKSQSRPQMQVVADTTDIFLPSLEGFLVEFTNETKDIIEKVLAQIPKMFANNLETDPILGPVMQAGLDALKSDGRSGKLFVFHTAMPTREAPGKLKPRDQQKLLGTEKEKTILKPQSDFYSKVGVECVRAGCSVDLFLFPFAHMDVATLQEVPKLTGGQLHLYNNFQPTVDGDMLMSDLANCVQKEYGFDAMVRVRTSAGIRPCDFFGNFYMETAQDVELGVMDPDKAILVELKHDDKLDENAGAHVQVALLYTSFCGERRLRIHNMSFSCCTQLSDMYKAVETDVFINWMAKEAARALLKDNPKQVKEKMVDMCANSLACYRKNCANPSSPGQLILPESMKLLPVYANNVLKSQALSGASDITVDNRANLMHLLNSMTINASCAYFYPRLLPLHNIETSAGSGDQTQQGSQSSSSAQQLLPNPIRCSADKLEDHGCYILENGLLMVLWLGQAVSPNWMQQVFGVDSVNQLDTEGPGRHAVPVSETALNEKLRSIISSIRGERKKYLKLFIVKQRDKLDLWFRTMLLEDKGMDNSPSYVDFLCHMHKEIRNLLN